ncbi:MAG: response regulator transcription factor [Deltaproteobacteria bacterium]|nr:response regulator transcription factor [Deltaproteobacteria bacterium]
MATETKTKHILMIDDDITALDIVSYLFEEKGYEVERRADGFSALSYLERVTPDLILVDLRMPQIDGVETVKKIRAMGLKDVPIIAFTAVDEPELHAQAIDAGCQEVLTKPCPSEKLVRYIKRYLAN